MSKWYENYYFPNEILEQAEAIQNCISALSDDIKSISTDNHDIDEIHIVGSGDCYFISIAAADAFKKLAGIRATGYEAYDYYLNKPLISTKTMVILFSSSGKSLYVLKSLDYASESGAITIGVTNHADSPLGSTCTIPLVTLATGISKSFPSKTTTSALALYYQLAIELGVRKGKISEGEESALKEELSVHVPEMIRKIYETEHQKLIDASQMFLDARKYTFVGSGPSRASALIGAAKIVETSRGHVTFCNAEEYLHLYGFSVKSPDAVIVIGNNISDHREVQVVEYAQNQCARVLVIGDVLVENPSINTIQVAPFLKTLSPWGVTLASMVILHLFASELSHKAYKDPDIPHDVDLKHVINLLYTGPVAGWQVD
ncbi:SIS domain-containing protein [Bacillus sp. S3]|uniref:SIS domain-containing protein n=1 Tax=Bacillus sp. S3 TaxID=486398 RepID=UPI00118803B6|nr:SIS domain-containing protein [Bacillus sp. S3]QCJ44721.1 SIS domain-containing protein [Bacillus sp. S3]